MFPRLELFESFLVVYPRVVSLFAAFQFYSLIRVYSVCQSYSSRFACLCTLVSVFLLYKLFRRFLPKGFFIDPAGLITSTRETKRKKKVKDNNNIQRGCMLPIYALHTLVGGPALQFIKVIEYLLLLETFTHRLTFSHIETDNHL